MNHGFFTGNRAALSERLPANSFVAIAGFTSMQGANDMAAPFNQESNFWYLTGIEEPDWQLLIDIDSGEEWLVSPHRDFARQMFDGGLTAEQAIVRSGVKSIVDKKEGTEILKRLLGTKKQAHTVKPLSLRYYGIVPNPAPGRLIAKLKGVEVVDQRLALARLRAIKQPAELAEMQVAIDATIDGFEAVMAQLKNCHNEYEVDGILTGTFRGNGFTHGFEPIIASGKNTCVMHWPLPKDPIKQDDWLLMDIGAKRDRYAADITRTLPIGKPSARHIEVYEAVERMHAFAFNQLRDGINARDYFKKSYTYVGEELKKLGVISTVKLDYTSVFKFMPHAISHGLGVDVHDPLGQPETLQENMVLTVEVGAYIPDEGIGVRLEDDVRITRDGAENMSGRLPIALAELRKML
jgi:Xaa-Pro aminopeptidase